MTPHLNKTLHLNNQRIPDTDFPLLLHVQSPELQTEIAVDPRTPIDVLDQWCQHTTHMPLLLAIASNPNATRQTLERLIQHQNLSIQSTIATHPNAPIHLLWQLFHLNDSLIDDSLVSSPNLTDELSLALLQRPLSDSALGWFARNPTLSDLIIEQILNRHTSDNHHLVGIAARPSLAPAHIRELCRRVAQSENLELQSTLCCRIDLLPEEYDALFKPGTATTDAHYRANRHLAENPAVPAPILHSLFNQGKDFGLWEPLSSNPACPTEILEFIAKRTKSQHILTQLRQHPQLTAATKLKLAFKLMTRG